MNREKFKHIARSTKTPDTTDIVDLVEITKEFPYFSWGFALLAKIYNEREDFRTESLMHQAALRVSDREWLYNYIHDTVENPTMDLDNTAVDNSNYNELIEAPELQSTFIPPAETTESLAADLDFNEPLEIELNPAIDATVINNNNSVEIELNPSIDATEIDYNNSVEIELNDTVDKTNTHISDPVEADEAVKITESTNVEIPIDGVEEEVITPINLPQNSNQQVTSNADETKSTPTLEELKSAFLNSKTIESEIDAITENSFFQPVIETSDSFDSTVDIEYTPTTFEPEITSPETKKIKGYYNIEDYYSLPPEAYNQYQFKAVPKENESKITQQKNSTYDFYSWLNSDIPQNAPAIKPIERREDLLDKFLKNKPLPTRPKQEFYSPEKAGKRSDTLSNQIVTETLANIYYKQGNLNKAIEAYQQLQLKFPEKMSYFANLIEKIKKERIS